MAETKKKIKPGAMSLDPEDLAILVNYEVQEVSVQPDGTQQIIHREKTHKKVTVKSLAPATNVPLLAKEIVDKCKLIHPSKLGQVEELLYQLQKRTGSNGKQPPQAGAKKEKGGKHQPKTTPPAAMRNEEDMAEMKAQQAQASKIFKVHQKQEPAYINQLDTYIEDLYEEDMAKKVRATALIAILFRQTEHFTTLLSHDTLLQTLARMMREDMKKSIDLCINIVSVFFSISNFSQFHQIIMDNQVGALTMDLIDLETKRTEHRAAEEGISPAMVAQKALEAAQGTVTLNDREKKLLALIQKQDRLLYLCFYMLLNLAEDVGVEKKMRKKNIVVYLVKMLDRSNVELLILATTFLKKLSVYRENKDKMLECLIIDKLAKFVPVRNDVLLMSVLRLLHNLSFDSGLRDAMVKNGFIPKAVELMMAPRFQPVVLGLLYHLSMDDKFKSLFTYTECIARVYEMLIRVQDLRNTPELIALAVNLTQNSRNAEVLCEGDRFDRLIRRAFQTCDELAFKVMRNLAQQESLAVKRRFGPYIEQLVQLLKSDGVTAELFVEVLGCLANLYIPEFDFFALVTKHDLLPFLATFAQPGMVDDDILLEVVMFVGVLCNEGTAHMLTESGLVNTLFVLMGDKKEDDEFVLQISFAFHKFLQFEETRNALLSSTQVVFYLVDLLQDKNKEVRKVADQCLDVIMDTDEEWAVRIRNLKFEAFNQDWLDVVAAPQDQALLGRMSNLHGGMDGVEFDYSEDQDASDYHIAGQRVVAEFDEFKGGGWGGAKMQQYADDEGQYDQGELVGSYPR